MDFEVKVMSVYDGCWWMEGVKWCRYIEVGSILMV